MVCAIAENPMVVYGDDMIRPGDWVNIYNVTGYVKSIHSEYLIVSIHGLQEEVPFNPIHLFAVDLRHPSPIRIYPEPMNLALVLQMICEVEGIEFDLNNAEGFISGFFETNDYSTFLEDVLSSLPGMYDRRALILDPIDEPTIIMRLKRLQVPNETPTDFFNAMSSITGYKFEIPEKTSKRYSYFLDEFHWEPLFQAFEWTYTYDHNTKTVRAKKLGR